MLYGFEEKDLPRFAIFILTEKKFSEDTKEDFIEDFLIKFLNDETFAKSVDKYYILFKNFEYHGYYKTKLEAADEVTPNDHRTCCKIDDHIIYQYGRHGCSLINPVEYNTKRHSCGPFLVDAKMHIGENSVFSDPNRYWM